MPLPTELPAWQALMARRPAIAAFDLRAAFARDGERGRRFSLRFEDMLVDYSKHLIDESTMALLVELARQAGVPARRDAMLQGELVNPTEHRAAMHTALRRQTERPLISAGENVMPEIGAVLDRMREFSESVRSGAWRGWTGQRLTDIVNIGIGGSDLGPQMVARALDAYATPGRRVHFVANVDPADLADTLAGLDPERTLFIVASKTFTTSETMTNAGSARAWLLASLRDSRAVGRHFVAASTNRTAVQDFGIDPANMFGFWDWVGGRYSLWSAIGLVVALHIGFSRFAELLAGARAMDEHFASAPVEANLPITLALLGILYDNIQGWPAQAVIAYDQRLHRFAAHLQQLDMESNGKRVTLDGQTLSPPGEGAGGALAYDTGPLVWGEPGTNGQHAFFQLLHQGTRRIPVDFLVAARGTLGPTALGAGSEERIADHQRKLLANCLAQSQALAFGRTAAEAEAELRAEGLRDAAVEALLPHKVFPGNRPSTVLLYDRLTPHRLGSLVALYEHKVFVQGVVWNINSFDQWGVELGKQLANRILKELETPTAKTEAVARDDSSTARLIAHARSLADGRRSEATVIE